MADQITTGTAAVSLVPSGAIRVNSGGPAYTDPLGRSWSADTGFSGGSIYSTTSTIAGTSTPVLYQDERYGAFSYQFPVVNGGYTVNLKFADLYFTTPGQRVFNVAINGQTVLSNFDIVAAAGGGFTAVDEPVTINVTNGTITIQFIAVQNTPTVSAIEIVPLTVSPASVQLAASQSQQFTANVTGLANAAVTWTLSPPVGTLSTSGFYTAPATAGTYTVKATSIADSTKSASASVTVSASVAISISPTSASIQTGGTQQFSATVTGTSNTAVTWSATAGSISSAALYTAPSAAGTYTVTAISAADGSKSASAVVTVNAPVVAVSIAPVSASLLTGGSQQFSATVTGSTNTSVTWSATGGTVSTTGLYTAPSTAGTYTLKATSAADTTKSASATITVRTPVAVSISPASVSLQAGGTQQFTATVSGTSNTGVTWQATAGSISTAGLYTAPTTGGSYTVTAISVANPSKSAAATVSVSDPIQHTVTLTWTADTSTVAGYNIFRTTVSGGPYMLINTALDASTNYVDNTVQSGQTYYYVTTAVTTAGVESAYSNQVVAVVPSP
jgi:hypothetical protein